MELAQQKKNVNLPTIIQAAGIELRQRGSRFVGRCPFHADNTPSLYIFDGIRFHCFGCGAHGDTVDFVRRFYGVDFKAALKFLGVEQRKPTPKLKKKIRQEKVVRSLIAEFKQWHRDRIDEYAVLCRCCNTIVSKINTADDFERYGDVYYSLSDWRYYNDFLMNGNEQELVMRFKKEARNGQFKGCRGVKRNF